MELGADPLALLVLEVQQITRQRADLIPCGHHVGDVLVGHDNMDGALVRKPGRPQQEPAVAAWVFHPELGPFPGQEGGKAVGGNPRACVA